MHSRWTEFSRFLSREINLTCRVVTNGALRGRRGRWVCRVMEGGDETAPWMGPEPGDTGWPRPRRGQQGVEQLGAPASERAGPRVPSGSPQTGSAHLFAFLTHSERYQDFVSSSVRWRWEKHQNWRVVRRLEEGNCVRRSACQDGREAGDTEGHLRGVSPTERLTGEPLKPGGESWEFPSVWDFIHSLMGQETKLGYWKRTYFSPWREAGEKIRRNLDSGRSSHTQPAPPGESCTGARKKCFPFMRSKEYSCFHLLNGDEFTRWHTGPHQLSRKPHPSVNSDKSFYLHCWGRMDAHTV